MHPLLNPFDEAKQLYLEQSLPAISHLIESGTSPVVIWDVGLGAGANSMAFVSHDWSTICNQNLRITVVSFDITLEPLILARKHQSVFPYTNHPAVESILTTEQRRWTSKYIDWKYIEGDFCYTWRENILSENIWCKTQPHGSNNPYGGNGCSTKNSSVKPNVICFDPFSQPVMPSLWSPELIDNLCDAFNTTPTILITYSISTAMRALFLSNGWYVAKGKSIGRRPECTLAVSPAGIDLLPPSSALLDENWLAKFLRSDRPFPLELGSIAQEKRRSILIKHPQFFVARR
jgi:hypothetical protein